jgi:hypothetical protein
MGEEVAQIRQDRGDYKRDAATFECNFNWEFGIAQELSRLKTYAK